MKNFSRNGLNLRTVAAFAIGATAGSIVALLYAPASGKLTRRRIGLKMRQFRTATGRRLVQTRQALVRQAGHVQKAATGWIADHLPHETNGRHRTLRRRHAHAMAK